MQERMAMKTTIALGIISILLVAGLGVAIAIYTMATNNDKITINQLNSQISSLNTQAGSLNTQISQLQASLNSLENTYNNYINDHSYTNEQYLLILAEIPSDKGITIDSVDRVASAVTGVVIRNLGVDATTVVSLKLYWTNEGVLASSASVNVVIPGNSTSDIQTSLPIHGWNTVYDTWILKVQTLEGYNATSDPLALVLS